MVKSRKKGGGARKKRVQKEGKSVAQSEFCELRVCVFESLKEGVNTIQTAESELLHQFASFICAFAAECFDGCIGLACGEYTAHDTGDMETHRSGWRARKQLNEQFCQSVMSVGA